MTATTDGRQDAGTTPRRGGFSRLVASLAVLVILFLLYLWLGRFYAVLMLLCLAALLYGRQHLRHEGLRLLLVGAIGLFLFSSPWVDWLASGSLEWWYPAKPLPDGEAEAIVVLSGTIYPPNPAQPVALPAYGTYTRCHHAAWLYKNWRQLPVLASGGSGRVREEGPAASELMKRLLEREGVPESMIWTEEQSRSTYENALYAADILHKKGISRVALVTEAYHMLRAERCFRKQGLVVVPAPCGFRAVEFEFRLGNFLPRSQSIQYNEEVLHEWVGLAWYLVLARI